MRKFFLHQPDCGGVEQARKLHNDLVAREMRGPGDTENAMRRLEARFGLDFGKQWSLRYRRPRSIAVDFFTDLRGAWLSTLERSVRRDLARIRTEISKEPSDARLASLEAEAEALLDRIRQEKQEMAPQLVAEF